MNGEPKSDHPKHESLNEVLASYLEAVARRERLDRDALVTEHPQLAEELLAFFEDHDCAAKLAEAWRTAEGDAAETVGKLGDTDIPDLYAPTALLDAVSIGAGSGENSRAYQNGLCARRFGDYEILEEIARGGMGVVYRARQISLNRIVAVKMILSGELADAGDIRRFHLEAEAAANLQHPNIVAIYEVGQVEGQYYYSMEYVAGRSLAQLVREDGIVPKQAAHYVRQIAEAIDHAHRHGVTHRDIKPSNVLIDQKNQARVTDFGLAKWSKNDQRLTTTDKIVGTAPYMAPEQITGSRDRVGPASDVYAIGALFYELLTGRPPFRGTTTLETLVQVRDHVPRLPRQFDPHIPRELELICLKCLEKNPDERYRSARNLAEDLERFLNGDSISISGPNLLNRLVRTLERSHHDVEFRTWARMLFHFAWIVFAANCFVFLVGQFRLPALLVWLAASRAAEFVAMGLVFWLFRADWYPPQGKPSRQLWALWLGYVAGSIALVLVEYALAGPDRPFEHWALYPQLAVLGSLGFIMMGSSYWGYCYGIGAGFLVLAIVMSLNPPLAPLLFGMAWGASLLALAQHLGKLARET